MTRANAEPARLQLPAGAALIRPPTGTHPALWLGEIRGRPVVFKDYRWCSPGMRFVGRFLVRRERAMYGLLSDTPGIAHCYGSPNPGCLALEYIPGKSCAQLQPGEVPEEFFGRLEALVRELHRRGVAHCDLKHRTNIIVTPDFRPYIVDLATALPQGPPWNLAQRHAFRRFCADDLEALVKVKLHYYTGEGRLTWGEWRRISPPGASERALRGIRNFLRQAFKAAVGRRRREKGRAG